jgi:predicted nucleic acid-binding protein
LDTSVIIAGLASPTGGSSVVLDLCEAGVLRAFISRQVVVEANRVMARKFPLLLERFKDFLENLSPELMEDPSLEEIREATRVIVSHDAPILAAAIQAQVDYLITLNTKDFCLPKVRESVSFKIFTPKEFLEEWRREEGES